MRSLREFVRQEEIIPALGAGLAVGAFASLGAATIGPVMVEPELVARSLAADPTGAKTWSFIVVFTVGIALICVAVRAIWGLRPMRWRHPSGSYFDL